MSVETERADSGRQRSAFIQRDGSVESEQAFPEPREFNARLRLGHGHRSHDDEVHHLCVTAFTA